MPERPTRAGSVPVKSARPDTKMPHFYLQANNSPEALQGTGQEKFPDAEINSIAYYLLNKSKRYVDELGKYHSEKPESRQADSAAVTAITQKIEDAEKQLADPKVKEADKIKAQMKGWQDDLKAAQAKVKRRADKLAVAAPVSLTMAKLPAAGDVDRGRMFFQEKLHGLP